MQHSSLTSTLVGIALAGAILGGGYLYLINAHAPDTALTQESASEATDQLIDPVTPYTYVCAAGRTFVARIETTGTRAALIVSDKTLIVSHTLSASGARYATGDARVIFWTKGTSAFIEEDGVVTYDKCVEQKEI
mgnify:CR=1 FL=1